MGNPGNLFEGCGGLNIASDMGTIGDSGVEVSPEWVLEMNPDILIKRDDLLGLDETENDAEKALNTFISRTGWEGINSVKSGRVYLIEGDLMWTPRYFAGRCYMAKWFQPKLFSDLDPEDFLREYHTKFLGIDYCGIWAYPQN